MKVGSALPNREDCQAQAMQWIEIANQPSLDAQLQITALDLARSWLRVARELEFCLRQMCDGAQNAEPSPPFVELPASSAWLRTWILKMVGQRT